MKFTFIFKKADRADLPAARMWVVKALTFPRRLEELLKQLDQLGGERPWPPLGRGVN
ncbi:hypothetical protein WME75_41440 [Sorangium sp. So ce1014]|uniref:hypothetical protein n=1 Tax=Sorangium sp. So ce1014 TaxID=3133326 RepID=UPI003F61C26A